MQNSASAPAEQFPDLLKRLPAGLGLDALARETKAIQRGRKIGGGANLLRLALARGPGGFSLRQPSGWVSLLEILTMLMEQVIAGRDRRRLARYLTEARLLPGKTLDSFDFNAVPMIAKAHVLALCAGNTGSIRVPICC